MLLNCGAGEDSWDSLGWHHHWTSKKSQIDAIVTSFLTYSWPLNKTGFNSMGPLTQTFSNSKYNSYTLSTLLEAVDVEEPSCQCAQRALALWLCGRIGALFLSCVRGNWTESISCWRGRATLPHCCYGPFHTRWAQFASREEEQQQTFTEKTLLQLSRSSYQTPCPRKTTVLEPKECTQSRNLTWEALKTKTYANTQSTH